MRAPISIALRTIWLSIICDGSDDARPTPAKVRSTPSSTTVGSRFYGLPLNEGSVMLRREPQVVPEQMGDSNDACVVPFHAGETLTWRFVGRTDELSAHSA